MMKISFLVPVYNCLTYLPGCVDSLRSVGGDCEILLLDDGSTDGSGALCEELAERFPEVRAFHQENAGVSAARNRLIEEAAGEWLMFADADDTVDAEELRRLLADARCRDQDLVIFGMTFDYLHKGKCYRRDTLVHEGEGNLDWARDFAALFRENALSPLWNKVFRADMIRKYALRLDTSLFLYEDFEFVLRYLRRCSSVWNVPRPIYHYRMEESKAQSRVRRILRIPQYLQPIEKSLCALPDSVSQEDRAAVLLQLHLMLAREKIGISRWEEIRTICRDFRCWAESRSLPQPEDRFRRRLLREKVGLLYLRSRLTRVRHWIAVRVKARKNRKV